MPALAVGSTFAYKTTAVRYQGTVVAIGGGYLVGTASIVSTSRATGAEVDVVGPVSATPLVLPTSAVTALSQMGVLDGLRSRSDALNNARIGRDAHRAARNDQRPDWLPDNWPEGVPYVSLSGPYAGTENTEAEQHDGVTTRIVSDGAPGKLSDAQLAGWALQGELVARARHDRETS